MINMGFGSCLADDMGLGKTIQVIALLNNFKSDKTKSTSLLIVPASLMNNWVNEISKFAPTIKSFILHPLNTKESPNELSISIENYDVIITTYGMACRYKFIQDIKWSPLVIDAAQAIKNPNTKQTKILKTIDAKCRIAPTGTPIENRLSDLWSLYDFLNQGMLGTYKEFKNFTNALTENQKGYGSLKKVIAPFMLRRMKSDKSIIKDLPDKAEMKTYAELNKKQIVLYKNLVNEIEQNIADPDYPNKHALILSSILKFKQICNHPDQYLGNNAYIADESGKFTRIGELCKEIYEKRERVLVLPNLKKW